MQRRSAQQLFTWFVRSLWILSVALASPLTSRCHAQASATNGREVALARALFEEGVALGDRGEWAAAADRFQRAYALKPTAGIAFNWASALSATGKLTQASELLEGVSRDPKATPELKQESERKLAELAPRRPRLKLRVAPDIARSGAVTVDGHDWPRAVWDVAVPVDPGAHVAIAHAGERELARAEISLSEGEAGELSLGAHVEGAAATASEAEARAAPPGAERKRDDAPLYKNWLLWTGVGAVVVAGVVTAVLLTRQPGEEAPVTGNTGAGVIRW